MKQETKKKTEKFSDEENNPCLKEHNMSLNCLSQNHYSPDECQKQFQNYKLCKTFWNEVRRYRRINGISPLLPPLNERESVKAKYFETGKFS
ncbi:coiled-coil-helix-coiled-coil-helix domain-containing protein 7 isoform X2 [Rhodnius prolixus]|uniref:Coiled-coil-helix-coiled-coil-helix domain-containing protein 7 n=1 Tax=Rhodnius prolixus TaxID=13249 RepID=R4G3B7_RHOPR